jgi:hypothetical protein
MMKKIIIILIFCLLSISANAQEIPNFTIMTEDWAPYNFSEAGETRGISTDIMVLMLKKLVLLKQGLRLNFYLGLEHMKN